MNSKTTWRLFFLAVGLFGFICFFERKSADKTVAGQALIFPKLAADSVTGLEIQSSNLVVRAEKTNDTWRLTRPFYPAQTTPIDSFVAEVTALPRWDVISASEVMAQTNGLKAFGLEPPTATLTLSQGSNRFLLNIGALTPMRNQAYAQVQGSGEVLVTDASILKALPVSVNEWRSPMLLDLEGRRFDRMQIRAGQQVLEFERDVTNLVWRISKPTSARANNQRIIELLQQLHTTRVKQFVTDSPAADLERYGLQTPALELSFALDTNRVSALEFGGSPTNDPGSVFVRRTRTTNVVLVSRELRDGLSLPYKAFHDPRLISMDANQLMMIQVKGASPFTVARQTNGVWMITEPNPMPADAGLMKAFLTNLLVLTIENFAKDVPTDADLKQFGLAPPWISFGLHAIRTNAAGVATNALVTQVDFGNPTPEGLMHARRSDETPVYLTLDSTYLLPAASWQLRDRQLYDFSPTNVVAISISGGGKSNRVARGPQGMWVPGDPIRSAVLEEAVFRLGKLQAWNWTGKGTAKMAPLGFHKDGLILEVEMVPGSLTPPSLIAFGKRAVRNNVYAAIYLQGDAEPTLFEFPADFYETVMNAFGGQ